MMGLPAAEAQAVVQAVNRVKEPPVLRARTSTPIRQECLNTTLLMAAEVIFKAMKCRKGPQMYQNDTFAPKHQSTKIQSEKKGPGNRALLKFSLQKQKLLYII